MRISTVIPVLRHPFWKNTVSFFSGDRKASKPSTSKTSKKSTTAPKSHVGGSKLSRHRDEKRKAKKATKSSSSKRPHSPSASKGYPIQLSLQPKVSVWCWNVLVPWGEGGWVQFDQASVCSSVGLKFKSLMALLGPRLSVYLSQFITAFHSRLSPIHFLKWISLRAFSDDGLAVNLFSIILATTKRSGGGKDDRTEVSCWPLSCFQRSLSSLSLLESRVWLAPRKSPNEKSPCYKKPQNLKNLQN